MQRVLRNYKRFCVVISGTRQPFLGWLHASLGQPAAPPEGVVGVLILIIVGQMAIPPQCGNSLIRNVNFPAAMASSMS